MEANERDSMSKYIPFNKTNVMWKPHQHES